MNNYGCPICKRKYETFNKEIIHHIRPKRFLGEEDKKNKVSLCFRCHQKLHALYNFKALKISLKNNVNFFEETYEEFKNGTYNNK